MVMGQEEKKNKARLEKAQVALTSSNAEYENAIKALEDTTTRWNRDWKAACDVGSPVHFISCAQVLTQMCRSFKTWRKSGLTSSSLAVGRLPTSHLPSALAMMR